MLFISNLKIMNKVFFNYLLIIIVVFSFAMCKEELIGQYPVDNTPPQPISHPVVTNYSGGARINYQLPDETDLLYVKATYTLPNGEQEEVKASIFTNFLDIKGFGKSTKVSIPLVSVDRSRNESSPVYVEIEPDDSPIYDIYNSMSVVAGFGGIRINWENPLQENIVVEVQKKDTVENTYYNIETFYSSEKEANKAVRGLDAVKSDFFIYVRDVYNNRTDSIYLVLTPWFEQELDKKRFAALPKSSKFTLNAYGNTNMAIMWDGNITPDNAIYYIQIADYPPYFAFDLGVKAKLSRFKLWSRYDYIFRLHSPKDFIIYGTNDSNVANNPESDNSEWILLSQFESYRPSGLSSDVLPTTEDRAYANLGEEFEFPLEAPEVRYLRFQSILSWSGTYGLFISEMTYWGSPEE
jgi:hypothetical protein